MDGVTESIVYNQMSQVGFGLLVVIVLIYAIYFVFRKYFSNFSTTKENIKVVSVMPISAKQKLVLVKLVDEHVLIGVTPTNISKIKTLTPEQSEQISLSQQADIIPPFYQVLRKASGADNA